MVSLGDTAGGRGVFWKVKTQSAKICLNSNFQGGGDVLESQNPKCQDLSKFQFSGGGVFWKVKTQNAKICLNFNFRGGGRGVGGSEPNSRTGVF